MRILFIILFVILSINAQESFCDRYRNHDLGLSDEPLGSFIKCAEAINIKELDCKPNLMPKTHMPIEKLTEYKNYLLIFYGSLQLEYMCKQVPEASNKDLLGRCVRWSRFTAFDDLIEAGYLRQGELEKNEKREDYFLIENKDISTLNIKIANKAYVEKHRMMLIKLGYFAYQTQKPDANSYIQKYTRSKECFDAILDISQSMSEQLGICIRKMNEN